MTSWFMNFKCYWILNLWTLLAHTLQPNFERIIEENLVIHMGFAVEDGIRSGARPRAAGIQAQQSFSTPSKSRLLGLYFLGSLARQLLTGQPTSGYPSHTKRGKALQHVAESSSCCNIWTKDFNRKPNTSTNPQTISNGPTILLLCTCEVKSELI